MILGSAAGQPIGKNAGCLIKRGNQSITGAAVFGAFAKRKDVRVRGHHAIIDDDAAIDGKTGILGQLRSRTDTNSHDHHVAGDDAAVF